MVGMLSEQSCVRTLQLDDVRVTYVVDGAMAGDPTAFIPQAPVTYWRTHRELLDSDGWMPMSAGGLLVETQHNLVLIDAGYGDLTHTSAQGRIDCGAFLHTLAAIGVDRTRVEVLAFTHAHADHIGWAFTEGVDRRSVATFPRARYVMAEREWTPLQETAGVRGGPTDKFVHALSDRVHTFTDGEEIAPGIHAIVTPGHSSGHATYVITTKAGRRLIVFGDVFHNPVQIDNVSWGSAPDLDPAQATLARSRIIDELLQDNTTGFGFHFGDQPFGRVVLHPNSALIWEPVQSEILLPTPRA
jgi:glyoxylase-like metal-dependent hydrolase (beta-lactamase superfamily II)